MRADICPRLGHLHDDLTMQLFADAGCATVFLGLHLELHAALYFLVDLALVGVPGLRHFLPRVVGLFGLSL
ncbi:hypothetical protein D3C85_1769860 [compost metagenome]